MKINIALDEELLQIGELSPVYWDVEQAPHLLTVGASGVGKTFFTKLVLARIALHDKNAILYVSDFKSDNDFTFLKGCPRFYRFEECLSGLDEIYSRLTARQCGSDTSHNYLYYFFDEWPSFLNHLSDKKERENCLKNMSSLSMLGRSFRIFIILSVQRADAQHFNAGARDNFGKIIGLGNLSIESKQMLFSAHTKQMKNDRGRGRGYMLTNGTRLERIIVPAVRDFEKLHYYIKDGVSR